MKNSVPPIITMNPTNGEVKVVVLTYLGPRVSRNMDQFRILTLKANSFSMGKLLRF